MKTEVDAFSMRRALEGDIRRFRIMCGRPVGARLGLSGWAGLLSPRLFPNLLIRLAHRLHLWGLGPLAYVISLVTYIFFGIEVGVRCPIGPGLFLPHTQGTVIGAHRIGKNVSIFQGTTLGAREPDVVFSAGKRPVIGDEVLIGAGAKVLGSIVIGDGARIGANAVVLVDMPAGSAASAPKPTIITNNRTI
jgi:serine O-acetyltransferase